MRVTSDAWDYYHSHTYGQSVNKLIEKVHTFFLRYRFIISAYVLSAGVMFVAGATLPQIARAVMTGFIWQLFFSEGEKLPQDLVEEWFPKTEGCIWPKGLRDELFERIHQAKGHIFLYGKERVGKTALIERALTQMQSDGRKIYCLSTKCNGLWPRNAFQEIANTLNRWAEGADHPPILYIDEFSAVPNEDLAYFLREGMQFKLVVAQTGKKVDPNRIGRFYCGGVIEKLRPLGIDEVTAILVEKGVDDAEKKIKSIALKLGYQCREHLLELALRDTQPVPHPFKRAYLEKVPVSNSLKPVVNFFDETIRKLVKAAPLSVVFVAGKNCHRKRITTHAISQLQEAGHVVYRLSDAFDKDRRKMVSMEKLWRRVKKEQQWIHGCTGKRPILYVDNRRHATRGTLEQLISKHPFSLFFSAEHCLSDKIKVVKPPEEGLQADGQIELLKKTFGQSEVDALLARGQLTSDPEMSIYAMVKRLLCGPGTVEEKMAYYGIHYVSTAS